MSETELKLKFQNCVLKVLNEFNKPVFEPNAIQILATVFTHWARKKKQEKNVEVFSVSLANIEKTLKFKKHSNSRDKFSKHYHEVLRVFN